MFLNRLPHLFTGLCCLLSCWLYGQTITFQQKYGSPGITEVASDIIETTDGYLITGTVTDADNGNADALLIHLDKTGAVLWKKTYGQFDHDQFESVLQANDGGFIIWGATRDFNNNRNNAWLVKVDNSGNLLWQKTLETPEGFANSGSRNIIALPDGYILSGLKYKAGRFHSFVMRVNNDGETVWSRFTPSTFYDNFLQAKYVVDSVIYLTGTANSLGTWRTMDLATGDILQSRDYQVDSTNAMIDMDRTPDGNQLMTGTVTRVPALSLISSDGWVQKVNAAGEILWSKLYKTDSRNTITASRVLADGSCIISMVHSSLFNANGAGMLLFKITANGEVVWARELGSATKYLYFTRISQASDGGFIAAGIKIESEGNGSTEDAIWMKMDSLGNVAGCCISDAVVTVEDVLPNVLHLPVTVLDYDHTAFFDIATADTAALEVLNFCSNDGPTVNRTIEFCPSQPVTLGDSTYTQSAIVQLIIPSTTGGCDTLATYNLELLSQPTFSQTIQFCPGTSVTLGNNTYNQPGTVTVALPDTTGEGGCDTLAIYTLEWLPQATATQTITFCLGDTVILDGFPYTEPGAVILTLPSTTGGCDTLITYTLELLPAPTDSQTVSFCAGTSVTLGDSTYSQPGVVQLLIPSTTGGCDTLVTYTLELLPAPTASETISFCAGTSVTLGDSTYSQPGVVELLIPSTSGGCDTLVTYTLELLPAPTANETIGFCAGSTVTLGDSTYSQPGVVELLVPSASGGCDTLVTYTLELLPSPTLSQTISFCPGKTVTLGDSTYSQSGVVQLILPSTTGGCDTLATYTLEYTTANYSSTIQLTCPDDRTVSVAPGATSTVVNYNLPEVASDCPCPGLTYAQSSGGASGSAFPLGINTVCYHAADACGTEKTCCFNITVTQESTCDEKTNGCVHFELLTVRRDVAQRWIYRVRITNNCQSEVTYAYLQLPAGEQSIDPLNNDVYTAPSGAAYNVRNPNYSPFYSLRFQPLATGLVNGQSDIFRYVLPAQVDVDYIHVAVRMASTAYVEAHLNTFHCPVGVEKPGVPANHNTPAPAAGTLAIFPNPAAVGTMLSITGEELTEGTFFLQDMMGRTVLESRIMDNQVLTDRSELAAGVYLFKIVAKGQFVGSGKLSLF